MARRHEHAVDIDLHDPAPVLRSHVDDTAATTYSDIVVEAIEPAELRECGVDHRAGLWLVRDIGNKGSRSAALRRDHRHGALGPLLIEIDDQHPGAGAGQQDGRRAAIADAVIRRPAPGDDRHLAFEAERAIALRSVRHPRCPSRTFTTATLTHPALRAGSSLSRGAGEG